MVLAVDSDPMPIVGFNSEFLASPLSQEKWYYFRETSKIWNQETGLNSSFVGTVVDLLSQRLPFVFDFQALLSSAPKFASII